MYYWRVAKSCSADMTEGSPGQGKMLYDSAGTDSNDSSSGSAVHVLVSLGISGVLVFDAASS